MTARQLGELIWPLSPKRYEYWRLGYSGPKQRAFELTATDVAMVVETIGRDDVIFISENLDTWPYFIPDNYAEVILNLRTKMGVSRTEFGRMIGLNASRVMHSGNAIGGWERMDLCTDAYGNKRASRPSEKSWAKIVKLLIFHGEI